MSPISAIFIEILSRPASWINRGEYARQSFSSLFIAFLHSIPYLILIQVATRPWFYMIYLEPLHHRPTTDVCMSLSVTQCVLMYSNNVLPQKLEIFGVILHCLTSEGQYHEFWLLYTPYEFICFITSLFKLSSRLDWGLAFRIKLFKAHI